MKIVLTGISGLIGETLGNDLQREGHSISALGRNPNELAKRFPYLTKAESLPRTSDVALDSFFEDADAVIHLAGAPVGVRWNDDYKKEIYDSRILTTDAISKSLLRISRESQKKYTFISASAVGYYGNSPHGLSAPILTESVHPGSDFLSKVCVDWEAAALEAATDKLRVAVIRTGIVLSTKSGALSKMITPFMLFAGGPIGSGNQWVPWIHLEDEIRIIKYVLDNPNIYGAVNAVAPKPVLMNEFANTLGKVLKRPSLFPVPTPMLQILFGEAADVISEGQRAVPEKLLKNGFNFKHNELEAAIADIFAKSI